MLDPPASFRELAREYVCARVTDVQTLDLARLRFDYDLTLAALVMNADGTIYHRFGGRDEGDAGRWSRIEALERVLRATLPEHAAYEARREEPIEPPPPRVVWDLPAFAERVDRAAQPCIHCHTLHEAERDQARADGRFDRERDIWIWPAPARVGIELDPLEQDLVRAVAPESPAAAAGLRAGDRLVRSGAQRLLSFHDLSFVLHEAEWGPTSLRIELERGGEPLALALELPAGWKRASPREYAWRPYKWDLGPRLGFGGRDLNPAERRALGLEPEGLAFRVDYLVTWGRNRASGENAVRAGLRQGDVVLALDGRRDFDSLDHVHAWYRLTREPGSTVALRVLRAGEELALALPVLARE